MLHFEFQQDGRSRLYWERKGEKGFCERHGEYSWDGKILTDKVVWVNPENAVGCSRDPDMQKGPKALTPLTLENGELRLKLDLGDEPLYYIWKKVDEPWPTDKD